MLEGFMKVEDQRLNMEASPTSQSEIQLVLQHLQHDLNPVQHHQLSQVDVFKAQETEGSLSQHLHLSRVSQPLLFIK